MQLIVRLLIASAIAALSLWAMPRAFAQQPADNSLRTVRQPYNIVAYGAFRMLILAGDFSPKVAVTDALSKKPTTGVGALSDARGEITVYDGKLIVSYGENEARRANEAEYAALLAIGTVVSWQSISVEQDVTGDQIETFLALSAQKHGIDPNGPFPFQIRGTLTSYAMHVNAAPTKGPHGMGQPIAIAREFSGDEIEGSVAGFYVSRDLVGIVSHGGTRTHSHWISRDGRSTAHLDKWGLKAGSVLMLPSP
jgi:alpha-acetolactate decarboxylase